MWCRGIRGATTADENSREAILSATRELVGLLIEKNGIQKEDIASAFFTTTPDLNVEFPAIAARQLGWTEQALLCGHEMNVPESLQRCIRVLVLVNTEKRADEIAHVYIKGARDLRSVPSA